MDLVNAPSLNIEYIITNIGRILGAIDWIALINAILSFIGEIRPGLYVVTLVLFGVLIYVRMQAARSADKIALRLATQVRKATILDKADAKTKRWLRVEEHIHSLNASDWRLAILEADILLEDLLDYLGYQGISIGDKLKKVNPGDMRTLDDAWEAHKVRNRIAHDGAEFVISEYEAREVIARYRRVFDEFNFLPKS